MPAVSVIMPVYNVAEFIDECVESIKAQTFRDFELIVVDDCGRDDSMERIRRRLADGQADFAVRYLRHERNRGLSAARNTGFEVAEGKYVYYLDSDDLLAPECLETLCRLAERTLADVTIGNLRVLGDGTWIARIEGTEPRLIAGQPQVLHAYLAGEYYVMAWNKLCRRDFLLRHRLAFVEGLVHEDNPWSLRLACHAERVALSPVETYVYRIRENSLQTGRDYTRHYEAYCRILQLHADMVAELSAAGQDLRSDAVFLHWYERLKALFFHMTLAEGNTVQQREMYRLIRRLLPQRRTTKVHLHYRLPFPVAYPLYRRMHRHLLC